MDLASSSSVSRWHYERARRAVSELADVVGYSKEYLRRSMEFERKIVSCVTARFRSHRVIFPIVRAAFSGE